MIWVLLKSQWFDAAAILNDYAVLGRYLDEDRLVLPNQDELLEAIGTAELFKELITNKIQPNE
jgi:hypothetical protein